ncbi:hypothetical protein M405DRAFT_132043 [Rhizopogon salebrosus TDB-379]|nr:hypothetical protein M405DRAFT_132043 [Rhizopogon salebrosus TDB-379]
MSMSGPLIEGDWKAFPYPYNYPFAVFQSQCLQMWDSPPTENTKPRRIETMPFQSNVSYLKRMREQGDWHHKAWQRIEE